MEKLAGIKLSIVVEEDIFHKTMAEFFTDYYKPVESWIGRLRRVVFPGGRRQKRDDVGLYTSMKVILRKAQEDLKVLSSI